jgi:outer membrane protein OmpA-like peptidoglycan-associated protein
MRMRFLPLVLLDAGSMGEVGSDVDEGAFGTSTMTNTLAMMGAGQAIDLLDRRFAGEVETTVTFAFNSDQLSAAARQTLAAQAAWMRRFPEMRFSVYGHTDLVSTEAYNQGLGLRRAKAVVAFLGAQGIDRARLEALVSEGENRPVVASSGPERQNRRAVTRVSGFAAG